MGALAFSHNPDDLVDWSWVILAYAAIGAVIAVVVVAIVRMALTARSSRKDGRRTGR